MEKQFKLKSNNVHISYKNLEAEQRLTLIESFTKHAAQGNIELKYTHNGINKNNSKRDYKTVFAGVMSFALQAQDITNTQCLQVTSLKLQRALESAVRNTSELSSHQVDLDVFGQMEVNDNHKYAMT